MGPLTELPSVGHRRRLGLVLGLTSAYLAVEVAGAFITGSLALLADAGHMLTDVGGLALALFAIWFGQRPATPEKTYGYYRTEILAALANAAALFLIAGYIFYEAYRRFQAPPEVQGGLMLIVAGVGLVVNLLGIWLLRAGAGESLNVQGAFLEVVSDTLSSIGVLIAGAVVLTTGFYLIDPIFSVLIGLFILPRTWRLLGQALNVLLEGTPSRINLAEVRRGMLAVPGVRDVHDLHIWTITSGFEAMSGHVRIDGIADRRRLLEELQRLARDRFSIEHVTIQFEEEDLGETQIHE